MIFPLFSFGLFAVFHWVFSARMELRGLKWIIVASVAAFALVAMISPQLNWIYATSTHAFLLMLYLHFYVGVDRSVSIRVLHELLQAPEHRLNPTQLEEKYPVEDMFAQRVRLMTEHGWVREADAKLYAADRARILVGPTVWLRRLYGLNETW